MAHFTKDAFKWQVCKMLVLHKLPYTFVKSPTLQSLLHLAHAAPSTDDIKLPGKDKVTKK
ncbi:hypothetical protein BG005_004083, partial [Podila minutissima]